MARFLFLVLFLLSAGVEARAASRGTALATAREGSQTASSRCDRLIPRQSKKAPETLPATLVPEAERGNDPAPLAATSSEKSYRSYLDGLAKLNEASRSSLPKAARFFQESIKSDYNFAPAYLGLAETLAALTVFERFDGNKGNGDSLAADARRELAKAQLLRPALAKLREKQINRYLKADPKKLCEGSR